MQVYDCETYIFDVVPGYIGDVIGLSLFLSNPETIHLSCCEAANVYSCPRVTEEGQVNFLGVMACTCFDDY